MKTIDMAEAFSRWPGGRQLSHGPCSGAAFRQKVLEPIVKNGEPVCIDLSNVAGLPSSFCHEAFTKLVRMFGEDAVRSTVRLSAREGMEHRVHEVAGWMPGWE